MTVSNRILAFVCGFTFIGNLLPTVTKPLLVSQAYLLLLSLKLVLSLEVPQRPLQIFFRCCPMHLPDVFTHIQALAQAQAEIPYILITPTGRLNESANFGRKNTFLVSSREGLFGFIILREIIFLVKVSHYISSFGIKFHQNNLSYNPKIPICSLSQNK